MLYLTLLLACNSTDEPSGKDIVVQVQKHASPKVDDFQTKSFECCDTEQARAFLDHYLGLTKAMAADDDAKPRKPSQFVEFTSTPEFATFTKDARVD